MKTIDLVMGNIATKLRKNPGLWMRGGNTSGPRIRGEPGCLGQLIMDELNVEYGDVTMTLAYTEIERALGFRQEPWTPLDLIRWNDSQESVSAIIELCDKHSGSRSSSRSKWLEKFKAEIREPVPLTLT